jgi:DNA-binding Xre family transcriptional regulator
MIRNRSGRNRTTPNVRKKQYNGEKKGRNTMRLRNRLDEIMRETHTSTRELAEGTGIDKETITNIRLERTTRRDEAYAKICQYFGIRLDELLYLEDEND